jgi:hypothetical protein
MADASSVFGSHRDHFGFRGSARRSEWWEFVRGLRNLGWGHVSAIAHFAQGKLEILDHLLYEILISRGLSVSVSINHTC